MATLANLLHDLGNTVSGYDDVKDYKFTQTGLDERGIPIYYDSNHDIDKDTIVTYSKAFSDDHKEIIRVKELGLTIKPYNEIIGDLTDIFETISVSGTHGKTTTSSLITHVLNNTYGCNYFIGDGSGHADKNNKYFVIESDEFNRHFLAYHPTYSIITNIELEHTECYKDIDDIIKTFEQFAKNTKKGLIVCGDNINIRKINFDKEVIFYGFNDDNDVVAKNITFDASGASFDCTINGNLLGHFDLPLYGKHMVLNALACITMCSKLGIGYEKIHDLLKTFKNAKRRFAEEVYGDIVIIDDYAHHPTEIKATVNSIKNKEFNKSWVVFQPHTYSRTSKLLDDFADSLLGFDNIIITDIYAAREDNTYNISAQDLVNKIKGLGKDAIYISDFNNIANYLKSHVKQNDIVVTLGAGTITNLSKYLI